MKWKDWLEKWNMTSLKIKIPYLEMEWKPVDEDKTAAWELYIELLTRIATQPLALDHGVEITALDSLHSLFPTTRQVLCRNTYKCQEFAKIAIVVLNQIVRPFTARWHKLSQLGAFEDPEQCIIFRSELDAIQAKLKAYARMLADMAGVEDLTELEAAD